MSRSARTELRDLLGSLPAHDLAPDRARAALEQATRIFGEVAPTEGWRDRLGRWWNGRLEPAFLTAVSTGWLAWVAVQMAALAR
jgi:hypothetical protein